MKARVFMLLTWRQVLTEAMAEAIAQKAQEPEKGKRGQRLTEIFTHSKITLKINKAIKPIKHHKHHKTIY